MKDIDSGKVITENFARWDVLRRPYDPIAGIGSPVERDAVCIVDGVTIYVPKAVSNDPATQFLDVCGSMEKSAEAIGVTEESAMEGFIQLRCKHDFEFWAATCVTIETKRDGLKRFTLNRPQRKLLKVLEGMRLAGVSIRVILLKARQWGGSTLVQLYISWLQLFHEPGFHAIIVANKKDQALHIRGTYDLMAKHHPAKILAGLNKLEIVPYQGTQNIRMVAGRGNLIGVGSVEEPDSIRSYTMHLLHLCISPNTLIPVKHGFLKAANTLRVGDEVLTHTGAITRITHITQSVPTEANGGGKSIIIRPWCGHEITVTPNHPIFTQRGWVRADELTIDDMVSMPIRKITNTISSYKLSTFTHRIHGGGKIAEGSGKEILFTRETGYAIGYHLAQGNIKNGKEISLARHDKHESFGDRAVKAFLPFASSHNRVKRPNTNTTMKYLYGVALASGLRSMIGGTGEKHIPDWFFECGEQFLLGILDGYLCGDGAKDNGVQGKYKLAAVSVSSVSSSLAMQIRDIVASLGLGWGAIDIKEAGFYWGRNCKERYTVRWAGSSARAIRHAIGWDYPNNGQERSEKCMLRDGFIWMKLKAIGNGLIDSVYDIEVEHGDHSFRTIYFSVKNSELGLWKSTQSVNAESLISTLEGGLVTGRNTLCVKESTAKGTGNYFHREWQRAEKGESNDVPVFVSWYENPDDYNLIVDDKKDFIASWSQYERFLWDLGATIEHIAWYREKRRGYPSDWEMQAEYPSTAAEAFQSTGHRIFPANIVLQSRENCKDPVAVGDLHAKSATGREALQDIAFEKSLNGFIKIWNFPGKLGIEKANATYTNRYCAFADIGGRHSKADYSVVTMLDRIMTLWGGVPFVCAEWHGHLDQDLFGWQAARFCKWYQDALLAVEVNSLKIDQGDPINGYDMDHSFTVLESIKQYYDNLYYRIKPETIQEKWSGVLGFHTNKQTKPMIIDALNAALRDEGYEERNIQACDEFDTYEQKADGSMGAVEGKKDDRVISRAGAIWLSSQMNPVQEIIGKPRFAANKKDASPIMM